jgi:transposase
LSERWCIPPKANAEFVCNMEDVLDVYKRPYDPNRPTVCFDERPKQLIAEMRKPIPAVPGRLARHDYEYKRNGVANLFMLFEPLVGKRHVKVTNRRTKKDWAECVRQLVDEIYPQADSIVLVLDNLNTHKKASLYEAFEPTEAKRIADKLEIHYTPKHGSWLNMAEIEISVLARRCLAERMDNTKRLEKEVMVWSEKRNAKEAKIDWRFTTDDARIKLKKLYPSID